MERSAKIVNGGKPLTIFAEHSILDIWQDFLYMPLIKTSWRLEGTVYINCRDDNIK